MNGILWQDVAVAVLGIVAFLQGVALIDYRGQERDRREAKREFMREWSEEYSERNWR